MTNTVFGLESIPTGVAKGRDGNNVGSSPGGRHGSHPGGSGSGSGASRLGGEDGVRCRVRCSVPTGGLYPLLVTLLIMCVLLLGVRQVGARPSEDANTANPSHQRHHRHHHGGEAVDGAVRLVGGQMAGTGNVVIYHQGEWGTVCDDGWNLDSAHIVCKGLGHPYALGYTNQAYFGVTKHPIKLDDVRCYGDENSILECAHAAWSVHNCDETEAAGVFCTPKSVLHEPTQQATTTTSTTTPTTTTATTERTTKMTKKEEDQSRHSKVPRLLARPTNIPEDIVLKQEVFPFMGDQREDTMEAQGRGPELEAAAVVLEPELLEAKDLEPDVELEMVAEVKVEPEPAEDMKLGNRSGNVSLTEIPEADEMDTPAGNGTNAILKAILKKKKELIQKEIDADKAKVKAFVDDTQNEVELKPYDNPHLPRPYEIRVVNGRSEKEGRIEVRLGGVWGLICSDHWTLMEARVACHQAGLGHAKMAARGTYFGGEEMPKIIAGISCDGLEERLSDCYHTQIGDVTCPEVQYIAGVVCTWDLPDLVPNDTLLETSTYLQDQPMSYLQCAMEEGCASSSAYELKKKYYNWSQQRRRLLRFTSSTWNYGTADFRPFIPKNAWEWHMCHMHYHSMEVFAVFDLMDMNHNRIAEGHKASFCLEDVECLPGKPKRYECNGYSDQGISVGCADIYLHNIDCQWIDITDVPLGKYIFRVHINPSAKVAELDYTNNAATCDLDYNGYTVTVTNCAIGDGSHMPNRPATTDPPQ